MIEITLHGTGGQGAVTAAELIAVAAGEEGKYSQAFPFFGVERRGAPVTSYCRIDDHPITYYQPITEPTHVIVLESNLLESVNPFDGLKDPKFALINTGKTIAGENTHTIDATTLARKIFGRPIVNTTILGAFSKLTDLISINSLKHALTSHFDGDILQKNTEAVTSAFESVKK